MNNTKERPIALTVQEVNAVLAGDKTQHRVIVNMPYGAPEFRGCRDSNQGDPNLWGWDNFEDGDVRILSEIKCPFGKVGDRLWVQEDHRPISWAFEDGEVTIEYRDGKRLHPHYLTEEELETNPNDDYPFAVVEELLARNVPILKDRDCFDFSNPDNLPHWRSADVMPKFASRLLLEITDIRIERVQDISGDDACAEGCPKFLTKHCFEASKPYADRNAISWFAGIWKEKYGESSYLDNPWVWVIEFKVVEPSEVQGG